MCSWRAHDPHVGQRRDVPESTCPGSNTLTTIETLHHVSTILKQGYNMTRFGHVGADQQTVFNLRYLVPHIRSLKIDDSVKNTATANTRYLKRPRK